MSSKTVTAGFEPKDTILWDLQEESLAAKGEVVKYLSRRITHRNLRKNCLGAEKEDKR